MANRPRKSPQAEIDVASIWQFIAGDSVKAADAMLDRIEKAFDMLAQNPLAGRAKRFGLGAPQLSGRKLRRLLCSGD